jgi:autoinducer 2 (AI-2) kinase
VLFTEAGEQAGVVQREWTHHESPGVPGGQDFDVHAGWRFIAECVAQVLRDTSVTGAQVAAVAAISMREGMVLYDRDGRENMAPRSTGTPPTTASGLGHEAGPWGKL